MLPGRPQKSSKFTPANITAALVTTAAFVVILLVGCRSSWCRVFDWQKTPADGKSVSEARADYKIRIVSPLPGAVIKSPLTVKGDARGMWYFEAQFPVRLLGANGKIVASAPAHAQGNWMTSDSVPFEATLAFATPRTETGTLVLEKDNPSGLRENAESVSIPVRFK